MIVALPAINDILHASQRDVLARLKRFSVLEIGRRWGKTTFGIQLLVEHAINGKRVGWFAPSYKFLSDVEREVLRILEPILTASDKVERRYALATGGVIEFWSLEDENAGRGRAYDFIVIDEAGFVAKLLGIWRAALRPTLTDRRGGALFLGTPKGRGDFHRLYAEAEADDTGEWLAVRLASASNPFLDSTEIASARKLLPPAVFAQEYEGIPAEDGSNPFGLNALRACVGAISTDAPVVWGVDLAKSEDWTVALALDAAGCVCRLERWQGAWNVTRAKLIALIGDDHALIDSTGVGDPIVEDIARNCRRAEGFKFTSQSKQQIIEGLIAAISLREIQYPDGIIPTELSNFGFRYTGGRVHYEAEVGHDDVVCALALAVSHRRRPKNMRIAVI